MTMFDSYSLDSSTLAGPLEARLAAIRQAGFGKVMLDARDVVGHPGGVAGAVAALRASGLRPAGLQTLHDFEGLSGPLHLYKVEVAKSMLQTCAQLGAPRLLVSASTLPHASTDLARLAADLHKLAMLAVPLGLQVAYKALSWGHGVRGFLDAWDVVSDANCSNLGLCLDSFHMFAHGDSLDDLIELEPERIFQVQLSDFMGDIPAPGIPGPAARSLRVFPGQGAHSEQLADLVLRLARLGYSGDYSLDVSNDDYAQLPAEHVAAQARQSAAWLNDDVLHRAAPLPHWTRASTDAR